MTFQPYDHDDQAAASNRFADAIALCNLAANAKTIGAALKRLRRLQHDIAAAEAKLESVQAEAVSVFETAQAEVKAIHAEAKQRFDAAEAAEQELVFREGRIAKLESYWRYLGEPADVISGLRSPEYSPLQKARMSVGRQAGMDPDPLHGLTQDEPDAAAAAQIDAVIRRDVGDERSDAQGNAFAPSSLTRSTDHKQRGAE